MALTLRYALITPGLSLLALESDDLRIAMHATAGTDALGDLARAVVHLLEGGQQATVLLEDPPGIHEWTLVGTGTMAQLQIHSWADRQSGPTAMHLSPDRAIALSCPLLTLARELVLVLDMLWAGHGPEGWGRLSPEHDYPAQERRRLRQLLAIAARRGAERAASSGHNGTESPDTTS